MTKYRSIGEVTSNPIANKKIMHVAISDEDYKLLKKEAAEYDTSVAEIIRTVTQTHIDELKKQTLFKMASKTFPMKDNGIFYRIMYGIKAFNTNGTEKPYDEHSTGKLYKTFDEAAADQKVWFDGQVEEMRSHHPRRRKSEQAFCYIDVVRVDEDNPDGINIYDELDDVMVKKIDETYLTMNGSDL